METTESTLHCVGSLDSVERDILSDHMRAVILSGRPSTRQEITSLLSVSEDVPRPSLKADQVLVRVVATALNIEDIMTAVGRRIGVSLTATPEDPVVLGQEFAGVVEEIGGKVKKFTVGDAVLGRKVSSQW